MVCNYNALQGLGYGTITPAHKTSTTHAAITDQAGLSHINTENFNQEEVQNELNPILTNDFNQAQALKELNAQVTITTEFGREAPKAVAEFSGYQEAVILSKLDDAENLSDEQINQILDEAAKWREGGIYRVALHTAVGAIGTGTVEGAVTTGGVAAAAPTIDKLSEQITEQLVKAGISEDTAQNATSQSQALPLQLLPSQQVWILQAQQWR